MHLTAMDLFFIGGNCTHSLVLGKGQVILGVTQPRMGLNGCHPQRGSRLICAIVINSEFFILI
jgi:hypothetical protein